MASIDSGVETGNESNDGPSDTKNDTPLDQTSTTNLSKIYPLLTESPSNVKRTVRMTNCFFDSDLPHFKLPHSSVPPGFGDDYEIPHPESSANRAVARRSRQLTVVRNLKVQTSLGKMRKKDWGNWQWTDSCMERKLRVAVSTNNIELVQSHLFSGVNPNCVDSMGRSPLHLASCSGYADIVRLLLENGANPNQRDQQGNTPLHLAACTNNIVVVTLLLKAGTDVGSSDLHGRSPLQLAQSKLKLLQEHMGGDRRVRNYFSNQAFQVNSPLVQDIPVYNNDFVTNQALQIVEMMRLFLQKRGQEAQAELLSAFSTRLTLSETKEQLDTQVRDLLDSLSGLCLDSATENPSSSNSNNCLTSVIPSPNSRLTLFSNAIPAMSSAPSSSFIPSASSTDIDNSIPSSFQYNQLQ